MPKGGKRPGAGRKDAPVFTHRYMVQVTPEMLAYIKANGGAKLIRELVTRYKETQTETPDASR